MSTTGEVPVISEASPVKLGLVLAIVGSFVATVGTAATAHYRLGVAEGRVEKLETRLESAAETKQQHELRIQRVEDNYERVLQRLDSIDKKLDTLADGKRK